MSGDASAVDDSGESAVLVMSPDQAYAAWQHERAAYVTGPHGNLALVDYEPVGEQPERLERVPASAWVDRAAEGVWLQLDPGAGVRIDGEPVDGLAFLARLRADGTPLLTVGTLTIDAFSLDGTAYELRVYDATAPALADFERIDCYPYDPAMALPGRFRAFPQTDQVPWDFTRSSDSGQAKKVPGVVEVCVAGRDYELLAFLDGAHIVLVFADGTTGAQSYAPGRFLRLPCPDVTAQAPRCTVTPIVVDFNRTFVPPCGFSDFYSCPIPPGQNRIEAPVRAGERRVIWAGGREGK